MSTKEHAMFRVLVISLLQDDDGISERSYNYLCSLLKEDDSFDDVFRHIKATDSRYYLPLKHHE